MLLVSSLKIDNSSPVLVTGATGYIAGVLVRELLELGVTVHAAVRDPSDTARLQYLQNLADKSTGSIKFFKGDLLDEGSYSDGMKGCSVVFHTASPCKWQVPNPQKDLVDPAVKGTKNVLNEATRTGTVKRVVLTSSTAAIYNDVTDTYKTATGKLTEADWNRGSSLEYNAYFYSKTLAEMTAWEIAGSQTKWSLVVINPSMVMGPGVIYHETGASFSIIKDIGGGAMASGGPNLSIGVVDVRDVALAHIAAAYSDQAKGRYIVSATNSSFKEMADAIREKFPEYPVMKNPLSKTFLWLIAPYIQLTRRFIWNNVDVPINFDNSKSIKELGIKYRPLAESMQDMFQQLIDVGAVHPKN